MIEDILFALYIVFVAVYAYLCYGKYDFNYWTNKIKDAVKRQKG